MEMDLFAYFSNSRIPSRDANAVHVLSMARALSANGRKVWLTAWTGEGACRTESLAEHVDIETFAYSGPWRRFRYGMRAALGAWRRGIRRAMGRCEYACLAAAVSGIEVIFEAHEVKECRLGNRWVLTQLLHHRNLKAVVAITRQLAEDFSAAHGFPRSRIQVLPDGANPVTPIAFTGRKFEGFSVGYTGHLYPGKGMEVLLPLARRLPDINFHVVGGTEEWISRRKKEASALRNVTFHGYVPPPEVGNFLSGFDVVICPNQPSVKSAGGTDIGRWTSPLKLFEYMAHGKAIVCSDLPVLREVMEDDVNALLCPPEDIDAWFMAVKRLQLDPALRVRLGKEARRQLEQKYTWQARAAEVLTLFDGATLECRP